MNEQTSSSDHAFRMVEEEARIARTARMLDENGSLKPNQRADIIQRCLRLIEETEYTQAAIARELGISSSTLSEILRDRWKGRTGDKHLARLHNWMELTARRDTIVRSKKWVETSVAREILSVARTCAETCKIAVVFGPAQIGKTFTLQAIEGDQVFGCPALIRVDEAILRPLPLCRAICSKFELSMRGTFDTLFRRLVKRLVGTKRMLVFDEAERLHYKALETLRDLHDETGCPVLFSGKPKLYERLGFRDLGDFSEVTDQLASRIVMKRDLTERTRGQSPEPLYTLDDVRKLIHQSGLKLHVSAEAVTWLQARASTLGLGGVGKALVSLYLAAKVAYAKGEATVTVEHLEDVDDLVMGHEDAERVAEAVADAGGTMRRAV
jgi:DNA transposition AAA+ family ATPase